MNKKQYQQPTMNIVKIQQQEHLLVNSIEIPTSANRNSYGEATEETWE